MNYKNVLQWVASTVNGRKLLAWLLESSGQLGPLGGYSNDPFYLTYQEGRRSLGRELWELLMEIDPKYLQIITSQIIEERIEHGRSESEQ